MGRRQVEFVELELHDFRCFGGVQRFALEPPTADGRSGITVLTGWGASGNWGGTVTKPDAAPSVGLPANIPSRDASRDGSGRR